MFGSYYRIKGIVACGVAAVILLMVAEKELNLSLRFVETQARIDGLQRTCAEGRDGPVRYVDCGQALPGADRRTAIEVRYISPADRQEHRATIRCDTRAEETPEMRVGETVAILAHRSDSGRVERRKCRTLEAKG